MNITLQNEFHNSEVTLRVRPAATGWAVLSPSQIRRSKSALCGISGCTCGGPLGERGPNPEIEQIGRNLVSVFVGGAE